MSRKWLITGCSTGFGRELAKIAGDNGDLVAGTLRNKAQIVEWINDYTAKIEPKKTYHCGIEYPADQ